MHRLAALSLLLLAGPTLAQPASGVDFSAFDRSVRPQDDLFRHVNGAWLASFVMPPHRTSYGTFIALRDRAQHDVRVILEEATAGAFADDPDAARVAALYTAYMDSARVEALGLDPARPHLAEIDALASEAELTGYFVRANRRLGAGPLIVSVSQDPRYADRYAVSINQGGLGLPDRSYYLEDRFAAHREAYHTYLARLFELAGRPHPAGDARLALALETELARAQWTRVQNRDRRATYNKRSVAHLGEAHANLALTTSLQAAGIVVDSVIVRQPTYIRALDSLVAGAPIGAWRAYLRGRLLHAAAPNLSSDFVDAHFQFSGRALSGQQALAPRWRRAVDAVNGAAGEAVGRLYVARHYRTEARQRMTELIENLRAAFGESIEALDWMSAETRAQAAQKLSMFVAKIGHPERWRDYSTLAARPDDLLGNAHRAVAYRFDYGARKLGRPIDRLEWGMSPQTVNAYYSATMNEIVFPAAILQPPFFDVEADDAVNYGAIGAVIGHEFSHGFDDQGRRSDGRGNLRDWWTAADAAEYVLRAGAVVAQYDAYVPIDGININGRLTLGENIADLAGLTMAYRAYRRSLSGSEAPVIDGLTGDQRFFIGWARAWRGVYRDEALRQQLMTDSHSPGEYRTNGIVQHLDAFHEAFGTQPGDGLWRAPEDRIRIW